MKQLKPHLCKSCSVTDPSLFYKSSKNHCKKCTSASVLARLEANYDLKEANRVRSGVWQDNNMLDYRLLSASARAKKKNLDFTIDKEYVAKLWEDCSGNCYYTGLPMVLKKDSKMDSVSLDRLDSSKGYVPGNVVLCRAIVNTMKNDLSEADFSQVILALLPWAEKISARLPRETTSLFLSGSVCASSLK